MCGIAGARHDWLAGRNGDPAAAMRRAVASLAWRGPDGQAFERAGAWWLGCARLAIGPANSRQPVVRRGGRFTAVMNGAITNARELWPRFVPGVERRSTLPNDAWLPLLAVERDAGMLADLRGHHAYAVADARTGALFVGRDLFGEKPLLAAFERMGGAPELVAFASTATALEHLGVPQALALRSRRMSEWFRLGWFVPRRHHVRSRLHIEPVMGGCTLRAPGQDSAPLGPREPRDLESNPSRPTTGVRNELIASVARCTDTRVPVALSLSGGLDSSCLALALAAAHRSVPAYQLHVTGTPRAEREAAAAVALRTGCELRTVDVGTEVLDALPFLTKCAGMPLGDPSVLAVHALARAAAKDGIRVLLGGEGADEAFFGYRRYRALQHMPRLPWLRRFAPLWSMRYPGRWLRAATAADPVLALLAVTPPAFGAAVLAPAVAQRRCWRDDSVSPRQVHGSAVRAIAARTRDLREYLPHDLLPKVDVATMAAGIEARCPFLESRAFDLVPLHTRELGKRSLRRAFQADLPPEVLRLPKTGFALPLDRWFRGELPWLELLAEPRTRERDHLQPGGVARAVDLHRSGRVDLGHGLYLLVAFELFLRSQE
jgi:asparagine synthase (glutamine-hydrolysing)